MLPQETHNEIFLGFYVLDDPVIIYVSHRKSTFFSERKFQIYVTIFLDTLQRLLFTVGMIPITSL